MQGKTPSVENKRYVEVEFDGKSLSLILYEKGDPYIVLIDVSIHTPSSCSSITHTEIKTTLLTCLFHLSSLFLSFSPSLYFIPADWFDWYHEL